MAHQQPTHQMQIVIGIILSVFGVIMIASGIKSEVEPEPEILPGQVWEYLFIGIPDEAPFEKSTLHYCHVLEVKDGWVKWENRGLDGHKWEQTAPEKNFRICKRLLSGKPETPFTNHNATP